MIWRTVNAAIVTMVLSAVSTQAQTSRPADPCGSDRQLDTKSRGEMNIELAKAQKVTQTQDIARSVRLAFERQKKWYEEQKQEAFITAERGSKYNDGSRRKHEEKAAQLRRSYAEAQSELGLQSKAVDLLEGVYRDMGRYWVLIQYDQMASAKRAFISAANKLQQAHKNTVPISEFSGIKRDAWNTLINALESTAQHHCKEFALSIIVDCDKELRASSDTGCSHCIERLGRLVKSLSKEYTLSTPNNKAFRETVSYWVR